MSNELQKDEFILPGNLGTINVNGQEVEIIKSESNYVNGSLTLTLAPNKNSIQQVKHIEGWEVETVKLPLPKKELTNP